MPDPEMLKTALRGGHAQPSLHITHACRRMAQAQANEQAELPQMQPQGDQPYAAVSDTYRCSSLCCAKHP